MKMYTLRNAVMLLCENFMKKCTTIAQQIKTIRGLPYTNICSLLKSRPWVSDGELVSPKKLEIMRTGETADLILNLSRNDAIAQLSDDAQLFHGYFTPILFRTAFERTKRPSLQR